MLGGLHYSRKYENLVNDDMNAGLLVTESGSNPDAN